MPYMDNSKQVHNVLLEIMITSSPFITKYFEFIFKKKFNLIKIRSPHLPQTPPFSDKEKWDSK